MNDPTFQSLPQQHRQTLQAVADMATATPEGTLIGAVGGARMLAAAGCSRRTLSRHLQRLERMGYVVCVGRRHRADGGGYANVWGIPARRGGLERARRPRQMRRMVRDERGRYVPVVVEPNQQQELWPGSPRGPTKGLPHGQTDTDPCVKLTLGSVSNCPYTISGYHGYLRQNHGAARSERDGKRKNRLRHVRREDLTDTTRLLALYAAAARAGVIGSSERERLRFVAMAEHALAAGQRPEALFAANVRRGRWLMITQADEDRAARRLKLHDYGERPAEPDRSWEARL